MSFVAWDDLWSIPSCESRPYQDRLASAACVVRVPTPWYQDHRHILSLSKSARSALSGAPTSYQQVFDPPSITESISIPAQASIHNPPTSSSTASITRIHPSLSVHIKQKGGSSGEGRDICSLCLRHEDPHREMISFAARILSPASSQLSSVS
ncbi:hypothetical protein ARMSODRAFT_608046 [Armillaria solidipes]|uniref:Uncharacterized protein n=1 Tax=Armillaria solidipes TaxID=1076256 RepID=A0A2H3B847_9AGAR|nr:hypothetical protein ARMSODRAFT_608046 [Armillaria solidipes]